MQRYHTERVSAGEKHPNRNLVAETSRNWDVDVEIGNYALEYRRLLRPVLGELPAERLRRLEDARLVHRQWVDFVTRCIERERDNMKKAIEKVLATYSKGKAATEGNTHRSMAVARYIKRINELKTAPGSDIEDITGLQPRQKYSLLPEEAQNAIWDALWPTSKLAFYYDVRGVIDICATTAVEPMASYSRREFGHVCHLIWSRVVSFGLANHFRTQHPNAKVSSLRRLDPDMLSYRQACGRFSWTWNMECCDPDSPHSGLYAKSFDVLMVAPGSRSIKKGNVKPEDANIMAAAEVKLGRDSVSVEI